MSRRTVNRIFFAIETVLLTLMVVIAVQVFVAQPYRVERESMLETLHSGEMVIVDKLTPRITGFARGDIIVFRPPQRAGDDGTPFIKRVIGLPGDRVELQDGLVRVNGVPLDESGYVYLGQPTEPMDATDTWEIPPDSLFVLGDHRADSTDSRTGWLGTVRFDQVIGRAAVRYWPFEVATVLGAPGYPELHPAAAAADPQAGPVTQVSISRP